MTKNVLLVGLDPTLIDFSQPAYSAYPGMNAAKVIAGLTADNERLGKLGYNVQLCLTDFGETAETTLREHLQRQAFDCILFGAGVRLVKENTVLFEKLVNVAHRYAPAAGFCFNTSPQDTAEALDRWVATQ